jgi:hypothetical protein
LLQNPLCSECKLKISFFVQTIDAVSQARGTFAVAVENSAHDSKERAISNLSEVICDLLILILRIARQRRTDEVGLGTQTFRRTLASALDYTCLDTMVRTILFSERSGCANSSILHRQSQGMRRMDQSNADENSPNDILELARALRQELDSRSLTR